MNEKTLTKQEIERLKEKHKDVYSVEVDGKVGYLRKPNRKDLSYAMAGSSSGKDAIRMNEILLNACWLGGDEELKTNDEYFFAVSEKLGKLMEVKEAELKKL